jgi:hypothetical protein
LNLSTNSINNDELDNLLLGIENNFSLKTLDLSMNRFDSSIIPKLCDIIETTRVKNLILKDNNLGKRGVTTIAQVLFHDGSKSKLYKLLIIDVLNKIDLSCIKAKPEAVPKVFEMLAKSITITSFIYDRNPVTTLKAYIQLQNVINTNSSIKFISLSKHTLSTLLK